jgi:protein SCO1/2
VEKVYRLTGVVRRIEKDSGLVTIRHDKIPGVMGAMTMPFTINDRATLDELRVDDEVEGSLRIRSDSKGIEDYRLEELVVTRPAPAPPLTLSLSKGQAQLGPAPQVLKPGDQVPDFAMTTAAGQTLKLSDLRGKVVVLTFIYTRCPLPNFCPLMDRKFGELASRLAAFPDRAARVQLLSVSFDPEHDTPEVLRRHAQTIGATAPLWTFAVATHDELARVAAPLGLMYGPTRTEIVHNLSTAVIDPQGRLARLDTGQAAQHTSSAELLKTIYSLLASPVR